MSLEVPVFLIVTPSFNSETFIDETILSVVSQAGPFRIRFHVQDGGSTDGTLAKLEHWASLLDAGTFPLLCGGVEFSFHSEKDAGMYDAINRGFDHLKPTDAEYMTYINSDDRVLPGALQFTASVFRDSPEISWLGGRPCEMNGQGELMRIHGEQVYPTASLRAGLHDGRTMCFVMQEGTFWRAPLWTTAGGFRTSLRQAGDWDLWRRFAAETSYVSTDIVLAAHRRRDAQLTADLGAYYREVDAVVSEELADLHRSESERFRSWTSDSQADRDGLRYYGTLLRFQAGGSRGGSGRWKAEQRPYQGVLRTSIVVTNGFTRALIPAGFEGGFGPPCGADPAQNLLAGFRILNSASGSLRFQAQRDGLHRLFFRFRNFDPGVRLMMCNQTRTILNSELPVTGHDRDGVVIAESVFTEGSNLISIAVAGEDPQKTPVLLVVSCGAMSTL
jgi:glycosyltransferase involved in cell wall biosynthesis